MINKANRNKIAIIVPIVIFAVVMSIFGYSIIESYFIESQIKELYHKIFNRDPDLHGLLYFEQQVLQNGKSYE